MATFLINPELELVSKYLGKQSNTLTEVTSMYEPETRSYVTEWPVFDNAEAFLEEYETILSRHELEDDYDNLLYLILELYNKVCITLQWYYDDYESKKRARELAQLLIMLQSTKQGKLGEVGFKSLTDSVKVKDSRLNDWISKTLVEAIEKRNFPIGSFGDTTFRMIVGDNPNPFEQQALNIDLLKRYANKRLVNPKNRINDGIALFSMTVMAYLQDETWLKAIEGIMFPDSQLRAVFDLLTLVRMIDEKRFDSENTDYLRTLLINSKLL